MESPSGKPVFREQFPTFYRIGRILYLLYLSRITRFVILPIALLIALGYGYLTLSDALLARKYKQVNRDLEDLAGLVNQFKDKVGHYPDSLDELVQAGIVETLPRDPFSKTREPYKLINLNDGAMVRVYSVGEDGMDNHSLKDIVDVAHKEVYYNDDSTGFYETLQIEWTKDDPDNGMSYFMRAMLESILDSRDSTSHKIILIRLYGWDKAYEYLRINEARLKAGKPHTTTSPYPELPMDFTELDYANLIPSETDVPEYFSRNETAFDLVRQGASKPYTKGVMPDEDISAAAPLARFLQAQMLANTMIAHGKMLEAKDRHSDALNDYLAVVRFGQAQGCNPNLIGLLMNVALDSMAYRAVQECILTTNFEADQIRDLIKKIEALEKSETRFSFACHGEHMSFCSMLDEMKISDPPSIYEQPQRILSKMWNLWLIINKEKSRINNKSLWDQFVIRAEGSYPETMKMSPPDVPGGMDFLNSWLYVDFSNGIVREHVARTKYTAVKLLAGLQYYKLLHDSYPDTLDAIADLYETPPVDPFTTEPFVYVKTGDSFRLYSPGPELVDDKAAIEYDPTNGSVSPGDIIFGK